MHYKIKQCSECSSVSPTKMSSLYLKNQGFRAFFGQAHMILEWKQKKILLHILARMALKNCAYFADF